ncbi:MAG: S41 family peptidase [Muribaculaceae bacterium]|nr:S41 family peptidase [Muribaculaceae bacterium]
MIRQRKWSMVVMPILFAVGLAGGIFIGKYMFQSSRSVHEDKLRIIMEMIDQEYVDDVDMDSLMEGLYPKLLELLDPHSAYIPASELQVVNDDLEGSFSGVGVSFQIMNDTVTVIEVVAGGPSEKVGLQAGDKILRADTLSLTGANATNENVYKHLRGPKGSKVVLEILRSTSSKPLKYEIVRGDVPVHSVDAMYALDDKTGYIRVSKFARTTADEFHNALLTLKLQGAEKYIIDLRGNSGGFMDQAIQMAQEFLHKGDMIVYTKGKMPEYDSMAIASDDGPFVDNELVVLTDDYSASASEIFAGAIQDNDRGLVVGRRSFGKGLVQTQTMLPDSSAIRLTIARYYTPSGRSIQKDYKLGGILEYESDITERFKRGEIYNSDSIKFDKNQIFKTIQGRTVYGGGGIMPDVFVPGDTIGMTSYYIQVVNSGLIQKYAYQVANNYRDVLKNAKTLEQFKKLLPRDNTLLEGFVEYAAAHGVPARWYYIRKSQSLILSQLKGVIARDILGYPAFIQMLNESDPVVLKAAELLRNGESPTVIKAPATSGPQKKKK